MPSWLVIIFQPQAEMETSKFEKIIKIFSLKIPKYGINYSSCSIPVVILFLLNINLCNGLPCQTNSWWDSVNNQCIPCTECKSFDQKIVLRPCQLHQDTICGSIQDLEIDFMLLAKTESYWNDRQKDLKINNNNLMDLNLEDEQIEEWWEILLITVIIIFLLFFMYFAYLSFHHMIKWRKIERRLDRDVEELSAKLMEKLSNNENIENGNFIIENPMQDANIQSVQVHCVLLDSYIVEKNNNIRIQNPGNLYTVERIQNNII